MSSAKVWLIACGAGLVLIGALIRWKSARYDLKDAAFDSAWTLLRGKRTVDSPTALEHKLDAIRSQPTLAGKASKAAGTVAGHFLAQVLAVAALALVVAGLLLILFAALSA